MTVAELTALGCEADHEPLPIPPRGEDLPYEDGEPLESNWHRLAMNQLIENVVSHWKDRRDFFAGGNMFVYFSKDHVFNKDFRGPDVFVVTDVPHDPGRRSWVAWEEGGKNPELIIELTSPSTARIDRVTKKELYAKTLRCPEYFIVDPDARRIEGWRLIGREYAAIQPVNGRCPSDLLGASIGWWTGTYSGESGNYPRLFDAEGNLRPLFLEIAQAQAVAAQAEAVAEKRRADAAEAELANLRAQLEALKANNTP